MINISKLFSFNTFIISFIIGFIFVYLSDKPSKIINIYPTPDNINLFEYKDKANNCYEYIAQEVQCPSDINKINIIPIQQ
tara:strand:- start:257 stop:496 length:240 start_codon:yes stop_codon:yes gene_type:complete